MTFDPSTLKYDNRGLIPAIAQDEDGAVLMMAWMNQDAVTKTLETRRVTYWSRSRQSFWIKGETSGHVQELIDFRIDCLGLNSPAIWFSINLLCQIHFFFINNLT